MKPECGLTISEGIRDAFAETQLSLGDGPSAATALGATTGSWLDDVRHDAGTLYVPQLLRELEVATACVREPHLRGSLALGLEQKRASHHHTDASSARCGDVEAVETVEKLHAARCVGRARGRHRIDDHGGLLPLKPVHRADPRVGQPHLQIGDLRVVRRDKKNILQTQSVLVAIAVPPLYVARGQPLDQRRDSADFFRARALVSIVRDGQEPEPGAGDRHGAEDLLPREIRARLQPAVVEQLGGEPADRGMEPPGLLQKETAIRGDGLLAQEQVLERGYLYSFRVAALERLIQLAWVTQQDNGAGALRDRQDVGERHLARLVHEQDIDSLEELFSRPEPRRPSQHRGGLGLHCTKGYLV